MKRLLITFLFVLGLCLPRIVHAEGDFYSEMDVIYRVEETGKTTAHFDISIENLVTDRYASQYEIRLQGVKPQEAKAYEGEVEIPLTVSEEEGEVALLATFPDARVGRGEIRDFTMEFRDESLAVKTGEVWEITLPQLKNIADSDDLSVVLIVPSGFGKVAYMSPSATAMSEDNGWQAFTFEPERTSTSGISAAFGQFQIFSFDITYHLENPIAKEAQIDIAIPPDTAFQKILYESMEPKPTSVKVDDDGNWLAAFVLNPRQKIDVRIKGHVQLFSDPREFASPTEEILQKNLEEHKYWELSDPQIQRLAKELQTPRAIYDYVVNTLTYNYERVRPNTVRQGAKTALYSPLNSICTEFTDLFIALARAAGIPAREVNGYAYTENPQLEPLSLVADVLHSWPEYWDPSRNVWVPVDPTWADTTGGVDFFTQLDLRHFAFVIHGIDSEKPYPPGSYKLGANPEKDVFVSFASLPEKRISKPIVTLTKISPFSLGNVKFQAKIENSGPQALYNQSVFISGACKSCAFIEADGNTFISRNIPFLAPFSSTSFEFSIPFGLTAQKAPHTITLRVSSEETSLETDKQGATTLFATGLLVVVLIAVAIFSVHIFKAKHTSDKRKK